MSDELREIKAMCALASKYGVEVRVADLAELLEVPERTVWSWLGRVAAEVQPGQRDTTLAVTERRQKAMQKRAERIQRAMMSDSGFEPDEGELVKSLQADFDVNGGFAPTDEESDTLVMGGEDGEVPEDLQRKFPNANKYLDSLF